MDNKVVEPLCFPLLFFNGEDGWGSNHNDRVPFPKYMTSRILVPEAELTMPALQQNDSGPPRLLKCNRFQALSRAFQTWIVSTYSRALDYRLEWARSHQDEIMCWEVRRVKKRKVKKDPIPGLQWFRIRFRFTWWRMCSHGSTIRICSWFSAWILLRQRTVFAQEGSKCTCCCLWVRKSNMFSYLNMQHEMARNNVKVIF